MYDIIDTHAHLDELDDIDLALYEARKSGVIGIIAVGSSPQSNEVLLQLSERYAPFVYPALGLHPSEVGHLTPKQLDTSLQFIQENASGCVAIGEIGLDYNKRILKTSPKEIQKQALRSQLELAKQLGKPVIIHSRYAWKDCYDAVSESEVDNAVFHWYTGISSVRKSIVEKGYYLSATPATEYHEEHRRAIKDTPLNRLMIETDCPVSYGREFRYVSKPADATRSVRAVSSLKGINEESIARETTQNAQLFFGLTELHSGEH
ncbi:MAG: TatD family hydrolase [Chloroflexota bacterium]|nr:TatD family hydrolase [Chloroflexota bacterium]